ncbi:MAG: preprotein translocase subunit SecE [Lachnospiraceae bacterium]|nr:preprotein translocase subunit SecE [Lachnospiraceae bacterium]
MAAANDEKKTLGKHIEGLKAEFQRIIWPEPKAVAKQSAVTIVISAILGVIIAVLDMVIQYGVNFLTGL